MTHKESAETYADCAHWGYVRHSEEDDIEIKVNWLTLIRRHWNEHLKRKTATEARDETI